jgi:WD40 repeat protein
MFATCSTTARLWLETDDTPKVVRDVVAPSTRRSKAYFVRGIGWHKEGSLTILRWALGWFTYFFFNFFFFFIFCWSHQRTLSQPLIRRAIFLFSILTEPHPIYSKTSREQRASVLELGLFAPTTPTYERIVKQEYRSMTWSPGGRYIVAGTGAGNLHVWDMKTKRITKYLAVRACLSDAVSILPRVWPGP